jgi:pantothenate kinase
MPDDGLISALRRLRDDSQRKAQPTPLGRLVAFRGVFDLVTLVDETPGVEIRGGAPYFVGPQAYSTAHGRSTGADLLTVISVAWPKSSSAGLVLTDIFNSTGGPNAREVIRAGEWVVS